MKYWTVFKISWSNSFIYRLNFLLWRFRSVVLVLAVYYFWDAVFQNKGILFGYTREKILSYVFLTLILRSFILGAKSIDVGGEISDGRLSNYLLKPISYFWYWFVRDWADKLLNLFFSLGEFYILYLILKPQIYFQSDPLILLGFICAVFFGIFIHFLLGTITSYTTFWTPGNTWGFWFVYFVIQDLLGGVLFPLDVLPKTVYSLIMLTPFPYLLYFPANLYLGKINNFEIATGLIICLFWVFILYFLARKIWSRGIKTFLAEGR
ncbi:MAG: ABC-2 family transporter protein [bacterium]|nr:ABC-2 family transporter protein [bacterium]